METFNVIEFVGSLTNYDIPEEAARTIVMRRGLSNIKEFAELELRDIDLLEADAIFFMLKSPSQTSSKSWGHGNASERVGTQRITSKDRNFLIDRAWRLYNRWNDPTADEITDLGATVQWLDVF